MSNMDYKEDIKASPSLEKDAYVPALESGRYVDSDKNELDQRSDEHLHLVMKSRHIAMISIGGVIGTGEHHSS